MHRSGFVVTTVGLLVVLSLPAWAQPTWQRHIIDQSSQGADGVRTADFNHDGKLDIVTGWEEGGVTRAYLQPSRTRIRRPWPSVTVGAAPSVEDAVAVDLDGDGMLDVVSSTEGKSRTLFVHWSPTESDSILDADRWSTAAIPASFKTQAWMFCLPMQVDGKRGIDLVTGSKGEHGAVGWWESPENPRDLNAWRYHRLLDAGWIMSLIAWDVDRDGDLDVLVTDRKGAARGAKWLELVDRAHPASPSSWRSHSIGGADKEVLFGEVGDIDQDGEQDVVVMTWNGSIDWFRRIPNNPVPAWHRLEIPNPFGYQRGKSVTVADLDQDGRTDLVTTLRSVPRNAPAVVLLRCFGSRTTDPDWRAADIGGPEGSKFDLIEAIDLDGDGDLDLVTCEEVANLGVVWYENPTL